MKHTTKMIKSILAKSQKKTFTKKINYKNQTCTMSVTLRYDDECDNGHNSFAITGRIHGGRKIRYGYEIEEGGCLHDKIKKYFPEFAHLIKWHLFAPDVLTHYIEDTLYFASNSTSSKYKVGEPNRWENATNEQLSLPREKLKKRFLKRLPKLVKEFKKDIEAIGFVY